MNRREFVKTVSKTAIGANLIINTFNIGLLADTSEEKESNNEDNERKENMNIKPEELVSYCGNYCGKCGICGFNIQTSLEVLKNVMEVAAFRQEAEHLGWPLMRDIATHCCKEFETQVASFTELTGKFFPTNCRGGCVPPCEIAGCCKGKGFFTCAECSDMEKCEKLGKQYSKVGGNLQEIRKIGVDIWAKKQFQEVVESKQQKLIQAINKVFV